MVCARNVIEAFRRNLGEQSTDCTKIGHPENAHWLCSYSDITFNQVFRNSPFNYDQSYCLQQWTCSIDVFALPLKCKHQKNCIVKDLNAICKGVFSSLVGIRSFTNYNLRRKVEHQAYSSLRMNSSMKIKVHHVRLSLQLHYFSFALGYEASWFCSFLNKWRNNF